MSDTPELDRYKDRYLRRIKQQKSESTHHNRKYGLGKYKKWLAGQEYDLLSIGKFGIEDFIIYLGEEDYAPETANSIYSTVTNFYEFLLDLSYENPEPDIDESPCERVNRTDFKSVLSGTRKQQKTRDEISYLAPEEVDTLCEHVPNPKLRNELMIRMMFQTGCRQGEIRNMRVDNIDEGERSIRVYAEKTDDYRTVYYQPSLDPLLDEWLHGGNRMGFFKANESPYVFVSGQSEQFAHSNDINRIVRNTAKDAGLNEVMYEDRAGVKRWKITSHTLRHSHAIASIKSGIDIERVRRHMGHSSLDMTKRYLQFVEEDVRDAYGSFGNWE
ncbi:site-specific integrase [Halococcus dombrowskii]|uniref:Site-specific integrase n=1 Tax=Halococcus dombrowskii TaxID=179637 RepID=A0AAV3SFS0_HALDO|nr:site-specific integrase [Halococcus dombrowskii]UOO94149.1 site-specific integrase [Halococcus dombrowskii]